MESGTTTSPVAGWYDDPYDATKIRYWNGSAWTDAAQPRPPAPPAVPPAAAAPSVAPTPEVAAPAAPVEPAPAVQTPAAAVTPTPAVEAPATSAPPSVSSPATAFIPPELREPAYDPDRAKIVTAVKVAAVVLVLAIGGAFFLLNRSDDSGSTTSQTPDQARTVDAQAAEQARTAQTAIETYATDNNGTYVGATPAQLQKTEASLAAVPSLAVTSGKTSYSVSVTSPTGDMLTIQRGDDGALTYTCSMPGTGICPSSGNWN